MTDSTPRAQVLPDLVPELSVPRFNVFVLVLFLALSGMSFFTGPSQRQGGSLAAPFDGATTGVKRADMMSLRSLSALHPLRRHGLLLIMALLAVTVKTAGAGGCQPSDPGDSSCPGRCSACQYM